MYDTEKRVELVKKRVLEKYRRKERRGICRLSALCTALSAFLVGTVLPLSCGNRATPQPVRRRSPPGECTVLSCCMKTPAVMCWWG